MQGYLKDCHRIEMCAGEIYRQLAEQPEFRQELRSLFGILSADELDHARQIDLLLQNPSRDIVAVHCLSAAKIDESLRLAENQLLRVSRDRLSEEEALEMAVDLETAFVKVHAHNSLRFDNPRLETLFDQLGSYDQVHVDLLSRCLQWWRHAHPS